MAGSSRCAAKIRGWASTCAPACLCVWHAIVVCDALHWRLPQLLDSARLVHVCAGLLNLRGAFAAARPEAHDATTPSLIIPTPY